MSHATSALSRRTLTYLVPIAVALTVVPARALLGSLQSELPEVSFMPGTLRPLDSLVFLSLTSLSGVALVMLVRRYPRVAKASLLALVSYVAFSTTYLYALPLFRQDSWSLTAGLASSALLVYLSARGSHVAYSILLFPSLVGLGCILDLTVADFLTKLLILIMYSVFDVIFVFKGYIKDLIPISLAEDRISAVSPLLLRLDNIMLGVGDVVFYSLTLSVALGQSFLSFILAVASLSVGFAVNIRYFLPRSKVIPGLPVPVLLSIPCLVIGSIL